MVYKYDEKQLMFRKNSKFIYYSLIILLVTIIISYMIGRLVNLNNLTKYEKELVILNLEKEKNNFTEEKLIDLLKELNVRFPHIVLAQAKLESGNYKSKVFLQNHNLFGMRQARVRVNTAKGTNLNHAYYDTWKESVIDYAFYQCRYMSNASTEAEYFIALDASYAEATQYSGILKQIIKKGDLKKYFK